MKYVILTLLIALGFIHWFDIHKNPPKKIFYIAMKPDQKGITWIRNRVLNHISNPNSPYYGDFLSTEAINYLVRPPDSAVKAVTDWLDSYNVTHQVLGDTIHCISDMVTINQMLKTDLDYNIMTQKVIIASKLDYQIPDHLKGVIQFIDGLTIRPHHYTINTPKRGSLWRSMYNSVVSSGYITREVMERVYNMVGSGLVNNPESSVGAMEYQGQSGFSQNDMITAQMASDVPAHNVSSDHIVGSDGSPDGESQLDMGVIWWGNGNSTLWYEDYRGWMFGWATSFLNRKHYPEVVSISWGWNERDQCSIAKCNLETSKNYVKRSNDEFMKLVAKGVTILVSSGDAGSPGRTNEGCNDNPSSPINPVFPGSSEWVTSVGATYLVQSDTKRDWKTPLCKELHCANGTEEQMTTFGQTGWTSGSGWAWWTDTPEWQKQEVTNYLNSGVYFPKKYNNNTLRWNPQGRGYPDVSAFGHSCTLHDGNSGWITEDGTSCSSPIFAGIISYLNDHQRNKGKKPLGFANPVLYQMWRDDPSTFQDITVGNSACTEYRCCSKDYGFVPSKGWDVVSGLGTPNIGRMVEWLNKNTN